MKERLLGLFLLISFLFAGFVYAESAPSTFVVSASDIHKLYGTTFLDSNSSISFDYKENTSGKVVYCAEFDKEFLSSGSETYSLVSNSNVSDSVAYVLANGYPNKSITGNNDRDYFITSVAAWYFVDTSYSLFTNMDFTAGTYRGNSNTVVKEAAKLINAAKNYTNVSPSISVKGNSGSLTKSGNYYVSSTLGVTTAGSVGNYTVTLSNAPTGAIVTDTSGNEKTTFSSGSSFLIKVPVGSVSSLSTNFGFSVATTGTINKAYRYNSPVSSHQDLFVLYPETKNVSATGSLGISLTNEVLISKQDATTNSELPGATLVLRDSSGNTKPEWTWVSTSTPHKISNLEPGKYTLIETIAPEGYIKSSETVTFTVKNDGTVDGQVVMKNRPNGVSISKKDATTGEELPGATLVLRDSSGNTKDEWTWVSTNTPHVISKLAPGVYTLTETIAPKGYKLSSETVTFTVKDDGTVDGQVVMKNSPEDIIVNPKTGVTVAIIVAWLVGIGALLCAGYYFYTLRKNKA